MTVKDLWEILFCAEVEICNEDYVVLWRGKSTDKGITQFFAEEIQSVTSGGAICVCIKGQGEKYWTE